MRTIPCPFMRTPSGFAAKSFLLGVQIALAPWAAVLTGVVVFVALGGGSILNPEKTGWLMGGDPATQFIGWHFFRHSPVLQVPLGANPNYGMEIGSSVVFSDSLPLLALLFKPFSSLLRHPV